MERIDVASLLLGVILALTVTGAYNTAFYTLEGQTTRAWNSLFATILSLLAIIIVYLLFFRLKFRGTGEKTSAKRRIVDQNERSKIEGRNTEETEQEKLKREFKNRQI